MPAVSPFLWFDRNAEEAMNYYVSVFENSRIVSIFRYPEGEQVGPQVGFDGLVLTGVFELNGQQFMCLDGGPIFPFTEAISLCVQCQDQEEIDYYWSKLSAVPEAEQCGWCKDKFGVSWQIVPKNMTEIMGDPERAPLVLPRVMQMKKIILADLLA